MKIAFYMEDGLEQIVLTPESDFEKSMLGKLHDSGRQMSIKRGQFYACRGGWVRRGDYVIDQSYAARTSLDDTSTILVLTPVANPLSSAAIKDN